MIIIGGCQAAEEETRGQHSSFADRGSRGLFNGGFPNIIKDFMKDGRTYETTEGAEKYSVFSKRVDKKQRHREAENRLIRRG